MYWKQNQLLVRCTSCYFVLTGSKSKTKQKCSTVRECVCVSVLGREGSWVFASTALVVVWTTMYLNSFSDWLTGFCEPLSPPYRYHTNLKNVKIPPCTKYHPSVFRKKYCMVSHHSHVCVGHTHSWRWSTPVSAATLKRQEAFAQQLQGEFSALSSLVSTQLEQLTSQQQQQTSAARDWTASLASSVNKVKVSVVSTPHDVQVVWQCLSVRWRVLWVAFFVGNPALWWMILCTTILCFDPSSVPQQFIHSEGALVLQAAEDSRLSDVCSRVVMTGMGSVEEKLQHLLVELQSMSALVQKQVSEMKCWHRCVVHSDEGELHDLLYVWFTVGWGKQTCCCSFDTVPLCEWRPKH